MKQLFKKLLQVLGSGRSQPHSETLGINQIFFRDNSAQHYEFQNDIQDES